MKKVLIIGLGRSSSVLIDYFLDYSKISYEEINSFYYFPSKRWDIKLKNNVVIKLSNTNIKKSLDLVYGFLNNSGFKNIKIIDARINDKIIING